MLADLVIGWDITNFRRLLDPLQLLQDRIPPLYSQFHIYSLLRHKLDTDGQ
jgi:hypothetical protein